MSTPGSTWFHHNAMSVFDLDPCMLPEAALKLVTGAPSWAWVLSGFSNATIVT